MDGQTDRWTHDTVCAVLEAGTQAYYCLSLSLAQEGEAENESETRQQKRQREALTESNPQKPLSRTKSFFFYLWPNFLINRNMCFPKSKAIWVV